MYFTTKKNFAIKYVTAIGWLVLALLSGCSDDKHKPASHSSTSSSSAFGSSASSSSVANSSVSSSLPSTSSSPYAGQWYAPAYGYVVSVSEVGAAFTLKTYSVTENYCILQQVVSDLSPDKLKQNYTYSNFAKEVLVENKGYYSAGVEYVKVQQLPVVCKENLQTLKTDSSYTFDAKKDFEIFWQTFNELYINFDLRKVDWDGVYQEATKSVGNITDEGELFEFLSALIAPLGDGHALIIRAPLSLDLDKSITAALENEETPNFSASTQLTLYEKLLKEYLQVLEPDVELTDAQIAAAEKYVFDSVEEIKDIIFSYANKKERIQIRADGEIAWFKTNDNVGYLFIGSMADYGEDRPTSISDIASDVAIAEATINEALKDLEGTDGLIVDVRFNGGGQDQVALAFVRHFMNQSQVVYSKFAGSGKQATPIKDIVLDPQSDNIYLNPTAVLVSGDTGSAAEIFTIAMASLSQVAIIGEPTAGAFSDILVKRLTSDILFGVSNETYLDVQGNNYEGIGIPADIEVPFGTRQERDGGYDGGLDAAIRWINGPH
ncbi:S41 family peptidase [Cellvibrio mixtus]|uniref:S41 family peptidase n=1 Tax=Cellvibrio mixtus TaxID=39650 RepID=UPI000A013CE8|nr:S41 family peptidase [Cellvibrio mixtus]